MGTIVFKGFRKRSGEKVVTTTLYTHIYLHTSITMISMILCAGVMFGNIRVNDPPMPSKARFTITAITPINSIAS